MAEHTSGEPSYPSFEPSATHAPTNSSELGSHEHFAYTNRRNHKPNGGIPHTHYKIPAEDDDTGNGPWRSPYAQDNENVLGLRLVDALAGALASVWRASQTVLRLDFCRSVGRESPSLGGRQRRGQFSTSSRSHGDSRNNEREAERPTSRWVQGIEGAGVRMKLMQIWYFPNEETGEPSLPWGLNVGFGACVNMDRSGYLALNARLQTKYATLHILPSPCLDLRSKFPVPLGSTPLAVNIRYRIPLNDLENIWESPGAYFTLNFSSQPGTGFHLTPGALEFDDNVMQIGKYTTMRVAASLLFPRRIPPVDGEQPFKINIHRLGLKTRLM
uniref:Uncharacterized protein n=1 Tax=Picea sitchensis TaxID=3332 RepID=A9P1U8_PICSI|nr:unknown [Picea sitchensis]